MPAMAGGVRSCGGWQPDGTAKASLARDPQWAESNRTIARLADDALDALGPPGGSDCYTRFASSRLRSSRGRSSIHSPGDFMSAGATAHQA